MRKSYIHRREHQITYSPYSYASTEIHPPAELQTTVNTACRELPRTLLVNFGILLN